MSRHGDWQAQRSSSGAWATSLEPAVAPIHHRRESAGSLDVGFVPAALQRVRGLRPLLKCALRKNRGQRTFLQSPAADGRSRRHWYRGGCLRRIGRFSQTYTTYRWTTPDVCRRRWWRCCQQLSACWLMVWFTEPTAAKPEPSLRAYTNPRFPRRASHSLEKKSDVTAMACVWRPMTSARAK